jgi:rRNA maturation protein Nop10
MPPVQYLCTQCGAQTSAPLEVPAGSPWVALVLAVPFVIPGIAYAVWRYTMRRTLCPTCGHAQLIPADAPLARTWRAAGWIAGRGGESSPVTTAPDIRIDRIEQAIEAIAGEVDRISLQQRTSSVIRGEREAGALLRERIVTPT